MDCSTKAALYIRVSTEEQAVEGQSVDAQIEILSSYCKLYNIGLYKIYKDLGLSGKDTTNRPGLQEMLRDAAKGCFQMVLVWKISRLSRSLKDLLIILEQLEQHRIVFTSYSEKFDTSTPVGKMTLQLLGSIAEFERNTIIDNVKLGLQEYARKGGKTGTVLGYDSCNKQLTVNTEEAKIVKLIYELYGKDLMSMSQIADHLNTHGYKTKRNNAFRKDSVAGILSNPVYIGINRHGVGTAKEHQIIGTHQKIIEEELWNEVQHLRNINKKNRPSRDSASKYLLSGILTCQVCKKKLQGFSSVSVSKIYSYYRCGQCGALFNASKLENEFLKQLNLLLQDPTSALRVLLNRSKRSLNPIDVMEQKNQIEKKRLLRLLDRYVLLQQSDDFTHSDVVINKIKEIEQSLQQLEQYSKPYEPVPEPDHTIIDKLHDYAVQKDYSALKPMLKNMIGTAEIQKSKRASSLMLCFTDGTVIQLVL